MLMIAYAFIVVLIEISFVTKTLGVRGQTAPNGLSDVYIVWTGANQSWSQRAQQ